MNDPFNRMPFKEEDSELHDFYAELAKLRQSEAALSTGEACFMASSRDVLIVLRYVNGGKDAFGSACKDAAFLAVINRGQETVFEADCTAAGKGVVKVNIDAMSAKIIKL